MSIAMSGSAHAITISTTPCVLNIPAKNELVRQSTPYYNNEKLFTFFENDLTCPDAANPFKTTDISYFDARGNSYQQWYMMRSDYMDRYYWGQVSGSFIPASVLGTEYGVNRIEFYAYIGSYVNPDKANQNFIRTAGVDTILNNDDDVLYPMTFSNAFTNKYRSDVSVKTKKSGDNLKVSVSVDRNLYKSDANGDFSPKYAHKTDRVKLYRDGKVIGIAKVDTNGKATFTIKDKKGNNRYSVVLPSTYENHGGSATFVR